MSSPNERRLGSNFRRFRAAHDFVQSDWPTSLKRGVREQAERFKSCLESFARGVFGRTGPSQLRRATFVLAEVPIAAVKSHLEQREPPPPLVDELITRTFYAIVGGDESGDETALSAAVSV
jgi:hypothetical protein